MQCKDILVIEEYYGSFNDVRKEAFKNKCITIGGYWKNDQVGVALFDSKGQVIGQREKFRLTKSEVPSRTRGLLKPQVIEVEGIKVLPIICYELLYPKDYLHIKNVDVITHHVFSPMFNLEQYEGWKAMYHTLSVFFNCPVVSASGPPFHTPMNVTGIVLPTDENEEFLDDKFDNWRHI